jgi:hypothetical protein
VSSTTRHTRAVHAALIRHRGPNDPAAVEADLDHQAARLVEDLCRVVDEIPHDQAVLERVAVMLAEAPPITTSQREAAVRLLARRPADTVRPTGRTPDSGEAT